MSEGAFPLLKVELLCLIFFFFVFLSQYKEKVIQNIKFFLELNFLVFDALLTWALPALIIFLLGSAINACSFSSGCFIITVLFPPLDEEIMLSEAFHDSGFPTGMADRLLTHGMIWLQLFLFSSLDKVIS